MNYAQMYNKAYEKITPDWLNNLSKVDAYLRENNKTLIEFFNDYRDQFGFGRGVLGLEIADLGCGLGGASLEFARQGASVTGLDVSPLAISCASEIAQSKGLDINYKTLDLSRPQEKMGEFDVIFDSHLLHCLVSAEDRSHYFNFVRNNLAPGGVYLLETMVFQKQFRTPVGYSLDENFVLWKDSEQELPLRKILPGIELESELKEAGLNINYLYFHAELSFQVFEDYNDYPHQSLPQTARLAAQLP